MNEDGMVRGVVVAHSGLAHALVDAVRRIAGIEGEALLAVSNEGLGPDAIRDRLEAVLGDTGPAVIFSDLRQGSCGIAAQRLCIDRRHEAAPAAGRPGRAPRGPGSERGAGAAGARVAWSSCTGWTSG